MVFADLFFLYCFLPLCLICYFIAKKLKTKNLVLIIFSLVFYAWGEPLYVLLLLFSAAMNWFMGLRIGQNRDTKKGKIMLGVTIAVNIGFLVIFKYLGFLVENFNGLFHAGIPVPQISLPIGISFFTFQAVSYIIDCYWDTVTPQKSFRKFLLYLSLFPQLIAGPIVRYSVVEKEIDKRSVSPADISEGIMRFIVGLAKKVIIANNLYAIVTQFYGDVNRNQYADISNLSFLGTWFVVICYSLYVYFDFSGYSDMAIGLGRIFGFHFDENFKYPFICRNIAEFWQRWHISLGSFFRDYLLYLPIGGKMHAHLNLFLVWFCTGMWHGASWNYIIWGLYFGIFIFLEQLMGKKRMKAIPAVVTHIYSKIVIIVGFGIFYFEDFKQLGNFFKNLVGANGNALTDTISTTSLLNNCFLIAIAVLACFPVSKLVNKLTDKSTNTISVGQGLKVAYCLALLIISSLLLVDATSNPFLYFRF